jgi:hypothetical protein
MKMLLAAALAEPTKKVAATRSEAGLDRNRHQTRTVAADRLLTAVAPKAMLPSDRFYTAKTHLRHWPPDLL